MKNIKIESFGPIQEADITFGDLTFFVGPQASGKSILLQMLKLISDKTTVETRLENYGYVWGNIEEDNLERFFGEGMADVWNKRTKIEVDGKEYKKNFLLPKKPGNNEEIDETIFYIPAQRVLCLNYGWPRFFTDFEASVPYVLRDFSETLRFYLEAGFTHSESPVFPQSPNRINGLLTDSFNESIFYNGKVTVDSQAKKRLKLNINGLDLPFMTWSTGQKEFMPLLMGIYFLLSSKKIHRPGIDTVIIEEPEMGLHPEAIKSFILQIIALLTLGYKVIVSTHSPVLLEFAWAFNMLKAAQASDETLLELFNLEKNEKNEALVEGVLSDKTIKTYYFQNTDFKVNVKDISSLDAGNEDLAIAEWGGLSSFASKASEIVSLIAAK